MKHTLRLILILATLCISSHSYAVPGAVCGNGKHVGNPHCTSSSAAPMQEFSSGWLSAGILFAASGLGLYMRKRTMSFGDK